MQLTRGKNRDYRSREYLMPEEVSKLIAVSELVGRHPLRDKALLLMMFRHGLRVSEAKCLKWDAVSLDKKQIYIHRLKDCDHGIHPLQSDEIEALRDVQQSYPSSQYLFPNERGGMLSPDAIDKIIKRAGELAELPLSVHPHMLRHSCGYYLANQGLDTRLIQDWLGHKSIQSTVIYTKLNPARFNQIQWS